jgi:hypothetical protein
MLWRSRQGRQAEFGEEGVVFLAGGGDGGFNGDEIGVGGGEVDFGFADGGADVPGDVEVEVVLLNLGHVDAAGVAGLLGAVLVGGDDLGDVVSAQLVLAFAFHEVLGGVDEEDVVGLFALFEDDDGDGDSGGVEEVRWEADDGVDVAVGEQLGADAFLGTVRKRTPWGRMMAMTPSFFRKWKPCSKKAESAADLGARPWLLKRTSSAMLSLGSHR